MVIHLPWSIMHTKKTRMHCRSRFRDLQKDVGVVPDEAGTEACRFCGSNTVPPDLMTELQSGALPSELKRLD